MKKYLLLCSLLLVIVIANILSGSAAISVREVWAAVTGTGSISEAHRYILLHSRIPAAVVAALTGAALSECGLVLQSYFRNPLAGPSILGITSGANLAVAVVMLMGVISPAALTLSALVGAMAVLLLLLVLSRWIRQALTLLIIGVLLSYLVSAIITLLNYYATADGVQSYMIWGMGNFGGVGSENLGFYCGVILMGLALTILLIKPLNGWLLGTDYARSLGISPSRTRFLVLLSTGILAAVTTAYCGPISFVGLSVPHLARLAFRSDDHRQLLPATALLGAILTSLCLLLSTLPAEGRLLPINALTPVFGVPVVLYVLLRRK